MPKTKAWPERPFRATHRGHRRDEAPQSEVRLCRHRPADRARLWHRDRQRCRAARACQHFRPEPGADGPSWLTLIAHAKDSVWSVDLFRVESILLRSHWVMLVMDVFTRRIIGFGIAPACIDGVSVCRMFNCVTAGRPKPKYLSTDHDPLFRFHRWLANLRVLEVEEIKSVPYAPVSHPFVERLIGTIRREYLDRVFSGTPWTWRTSRRNTRTITTRIASTAR